jgi:AmmeMemoRadiSam system protein B
MDFPKVRPVEAIPLEIDDQAVVCLRDPLGYAVETVLLPQPAFFIVSLFDGRHAIADIRERFAQQFQQAVPVEAIQKLIADLDSHYYLESERFASLERDVRTRFRDTPVRSLAHAGTSYEADPERFRAQLTSFFTNRSGPGLPMRRADGHDRTLRAIIAPHIDLRVGGPCYAWAYRELAERSDADVFVLLGTSHAPSSHPFIVTQKDFETPLGPVQADGPFVDRLRRAYGHELLRDEILHRSEHSIEFQVLFLQHLLGSVRPFTIVPILVGSFHHMIERGRPPVEDPSIGAFTDALRRTIADESRSVCLVAGVDFAHVGRKFGDAEGLDSTLLGQVEAQDHRLISALQDVDATAFFNEVATVRDRFRICGFSPMYTLLSTLDAGRGQLLRYDRNDDPQTQSAVSFASLAFD